MSEQSIVTGMVLSDMPIGDYDKRLLLLTKEFGKISAFVRGGRKPGNSLSGSCRPFTFGKISLFQGKNSFTITGFEVINYFSELSSDLEGTYYGFYFLELADYFGREGIDGEETLKLLYQSYKALINKNIHNELVRSIYELRLFMINGEYPSVNCCIKCGKKEDLLFFSREKGGCLCSECERCAMDRVQMNTSTFYAMQFIISTPIEKLFSFRVSQQVQFEIEEVMKHFIKDHVDKKLKSLEILENIIIKE